MTAQVFFHRGDDTTTVLVKPRLLQAAKEKSVNAFVPMHSETVADLKRGVVIAQQIRISGPIRHDRAGPRSIISQKRGRFVLFQNSLSQYRALLLVLKEVFPSKAGLTKTAECFSFCYP